jgi:hypothetical protein
MFAAKIVLLLEATNILHLIQLHNMEHNLSTE